jgi:hypothetical protein
VTVERISASKTRTARRRLQRYIGMALASVALYRPVKAEFVRRQKRHGDPPLVRAADALFLHVETDAAISATPGACVGMADRHRVIMPG